MIKNKDNEKENDNDKKKENNDKRQENNEKITSKNNEKRKDMKSDDPDFVGTPEFMAPELFEAHKYGGINDERYICLDFWSIGCLIYQLLSNKILFKAQTEYLVFQKVSQWNYEIPSEIKDEYALDLLQKLLKKTPLDRLGVKNRNDLKEHKFFQAKIDWNKLSDLPPPLINEAYLKTQKQDEE